MVKQRKAEKLNYEASPRRVFALRQPLRSILVAILLLLANPCLGSQIEDCAAAFAHADYDRALKACRPPAEKGHTDAQANMGFMYDNARGVKPNHVEAARWYRLAAAKGHAGSQYHLALIYYKGQGIAQNFTEAAKWYQRAAVQGIAQAQYQLGLMLENGRGVEKNNAEAAKWYQLAASQGLAGAQFSLGLSYAKGQGVKQDTGLSRMWIILAAESGDADAVMIRNVDSKLTTAQDNEVAIKLARECKKRSLRNCN